MIGPVNTVIFFTEFPFTGRDVLRFGLDILKKNGFHVGVWDISRYILRDAAEKVAAAGEPSWEPVSYYATEEEILAALSRVDRHALLIMLVDYNLDTLSLYRAISRNDLRFAVLYLNAFPAPLESYSFLTRVKNFLASLPSADKRQALRTLWNELLRAWYPLFGVRPASVCILGGTKALDFRNKPISSRTVKVWLHSLDYDNYLVEKSRPSRLNRQQWVYIETYSRSDPDQFFCPHDRAFRPDDAFFEQLRDTFTSLEETFGVRIVVVEHPKKLHDDTLSYGGRQCFRGNTAEVIRSSAAVLSHDSTAINYAVLFEKPLLFLTSRAIAATDNGRKVEALAHIFGKEPLFIDEDRITVPDSAIAVDVDLYQRYITEYITKNREELPAWEIFSRFLKDGKAPS